MRYILTTVGLSCLTNGLKGIFIPKEIYMHSNKNEKEIDKDFKSKFEVELEKLKQQIIHFNSEELSKLSAEINALLKYYKDSFVNQDFHKLLATDTYLGKKAAEVVKVFLDNKGFNVDIYTPKDLKTSDIESFHISLSEIVRDLSTELDGYRSSDYKIIFNLTGGFKSINSFMQSMASLWADESIYIFETSKELLSIPRLPLRIDEKIFKEKFMVFRLLESNIGVDKNSLKNIYKSLIIQIGDEYTLSPWGELVWQKMKLEIFKDLVEFDYIGYSNDFKKDFEKLNSNEKIQINKMLDLLDKYRRTNDSKFNLKSLRFHELKGDIANRYSYEFYPFEGDNSKRAYCNIKDQKIIVEKIDAHLK